MNAAPDATATAPPATLNDLLHRAAEVADAGLRFVDRRERADFLTWRELRERALVVAAGLAAVGVEPGERVVLVFPTGPPFFDAFLGTLLAGAVPVPLYPPVRLGRLAEYHRRTAGMVRAAGARLVLAEARVKRVLGETVEQARPALGCRTPDELPRGGGGYRPPEVGEDALALVQFSSGTTVDPKPVALSHRAVLAQTRLLNGFWPDEPAAGVVHSGVSWLPLYHDMGLIGCVFPALERPADLTLLPPEAFVARPALWLRALSRYRGTISPAPNFAYGLCVHKVRDEEMEGVDLSSWYGALNGAEPVAPRVLRAFRDRFSRWGLRHEALTPVYGLSEAALAVTFSPLDRPFTSRRFDRGGLVARGEARERGDRPGADGGGGRAVGEPSGEEDFPGDPEADWKATGGVGDEGAGDDPAGNGGGRTAGNPDTAGTRVPAALGEAAGDGAANPETVELVSVGLPLPGFQVRVMPAGDDPSEEDRPTAPGRAEPLPEGRVGRIWVRGPSLMEGYLGRPDLTARALVDGWLDTGDLGFLHRGELYLAGRAKDVVILRGRNHSPAEIEHALEGLAGLRRGCAVAVSHLPPGAETEHLLVFVEAASGATAEERDGLPAACAGAVLAATGLAADRVVVLEPGTLPRTSSGKLRRGETLKRHLDGNLEPPRPLGPVRLAGHLARSGLAFAREGLRRRRDDRPDQGSSADPPAGVQEPGAGASGTVGEEASAGGAGGPSLDGRTGTGPSAGGEAPSGVPREGRDPLPAGRSPVEGGTVGEAADGPPREGGDPRAVAADDAGDDR